MWQCVCGIENDDQVMNCQKCYGNRNHVKRIREKEEHLGRTQPAPGGPVGIGGWLILPAIGLVLSPIIGFGRLFMAFSQVSNIEDASYRDLVGLDLLIQVGLLAFLLFVAVQFFGKKGAAPPAMIVLLLLYVLGSGLIYAVAHNERSQSRSPNAMSSSETSFRR
jgi:hypothetical protein